MSLRKTNSNVFCHLWAFHLYLLTLCLLLTASGTCQQLKSKLSSAISARRSPRERTAHFCQDGF